MSDGKKRKTEAEKLEELKVKIEQMKNREKAIKQKLSNEERKKRTKRLIEYGAIFEKFFELENKEIAPEKLQDLLNKNIEEIKEFRKIFI